MDSRFPWFFNFGDDYNNNIDRSTTPQNVKPTTTRLYQVEPGLLQPDAKFFSTHKQSVSAAQQIESDFLKHGKEFQKFWQDKISKNIAGIARSGTSFFKSEQQEIPLIIDQKNYFSFERQATQQIHEHVLDLDPSYKKILATGTPTYRVLAHNWPRNACGCRVQPREEHITGPQWMYKELARIIKVENNNVAANEVVI